ncbi:AAA family ATPase [Streptomyces hirsutus]|uniref:AAA family ATPase n=1 Tax=Streptomyces hirsutus TaxID=35620 RepID=UPI0033AF0960
MATKRDKLDVDATTMRDSWRRRAETVVGDVDAMVAAAAPGPPGPDGCAGLDGPGTGPRIPPPGDIAAVVFDPKEGLTANDKTFSRAQLLAAVANALEFGIDADPDGLERLVDDVLEVEGYAVRVPTLGSTVLSSIDRYTTQDILDAEETVRAQTLERFDTGAVQLTGNRAAAAIDVFQVAAGFELSAEQQAAVARVLTAGHGIDALVDVAGAGKSTLMEACRIGWDATGTTYAGATLAAVAAKQLHDASGIPARTVAAWLGEIENGSGLRGVDVLVVDEATMVDDRAAAVLLGEAARTGTKVVGIGDHLQLQAIGPGGWFKETHRLVNGLTLTENRRQEDAAERAALDVWRTGNHELALRMLAEGGRIHPAETADEARSQILPPGAGRGPARGAGPACRGEGQAAARPRPGRCRGTRGPVLDEAHLRRRLPPGAEPAHRRGRPARHRRRGQRHRGGEPGPGTRRAPRPRAGHRPAHPGAAVRRRGRGGPRPGGRPGRHRPGTSGDRVRRGRPRRGPRPAARQARRERGQEPHRAAPGGHVPEGVPRS